MVDLGGFVQMGQSTIRWTSANVAALYRKIDADFLVSLDVPPHGHDDEIDWRRKYLRNLANLERLYDGFGERIVLVVHGAVFGEVELADQRLDRRPVDDVERIERAAAVRGLRIPLGIGA